MGSDSPIVFVVDDDYRVREALSSLVTSIGLEVAVFGSAQEFLEFDKPDSRPAWSWIWNSRAPAAWNFSGSWPPAMVRR